MRVLAGCIGHPVLRAEIARRPVSRGPVKRGLGQPKASLAGAAPVQSGCRPHGRSKPGSPPAD